MTHEQKFFQALKDVFIGAPVEGESGYINLMRQGLLLRAGDRAALAGQRRSAVWYWDEI